MLGLYAVQKAVLGITIFVTHLRMASQGESKLPLPSAAKEKRRSHLPSPQSFRKSAGKPVTPDPPRRHGNLEHSATSMSTELSPESPYRLGDRVCIAGVKPGILRYYGRTKFAEGEWCGIELDDCEGKHDGTVDNINYFSCKEGYGIFAPSFKVQPLNEWVLPERPSKLHQPKPSGIPGIPKLRASRSKSPEEIPPGEKKLKKSLGDLASGDPSSLPQSPRFVSKLARPKSIGCDPRVQQKAFPVEGGFDPGRISSERSPLQGDKQSRPPRLPKQTSGLPIKRSHSALEPSDVKKYHSAIPKPGSKKDLGASQQVKAAVKPSGEDLLTQSEYNESTRRVSRGERTSKARSLSYDLTAEGHSSFGLGLAPKDSVLRSSSSSLCSRSSSGSLISPIPDKSGRTVVHIKKTPLVFGGEAMSEPEDDTDLLGGTKLSHASSLGILPDSVLINNSLLTEELRVGKELKADYMECKESTEMMEKDLDQEISGISTPEIDMSGSTISGKDVCSSPELEGKRDLNNYGADSTEAKGQQAQVGEMPASPGSSENSPNSEIEIKSKDKSKEDDLSAKSRNKEDAVDGGEDTSHLCEQDNPEQYPSGMRTSIDLEDLDSSSMTASVEIAKTAVQQYAELMAAAERERRASLKHREARKAARREAERARSFDSDEEAFTAPKTEHSDRVAMDTERTQLLVDLQAGHTKRDRPVSMISVGSADTGIVADLPATPSKKERPLSLVSTSSVDTGYQPDTDSEIGTLTMNSPLEDESVAASNNNNQAEELSPRSEALSLDAAYKDTFSRFQKVVQKGTMRENEITSDIHSDTGTLVCESETEPVEADIQDLIIQNTLLEYGLEEMLQCVPHGRGAHNGSPVDDQSPDFPQETPGSSTEEEDLALYEGTHTPLSEVHGPMETIPEQDTPESPDVEFPGQKDSSLTNNDTTSTVSVTSDPEVDTELLDDVNNAKGTIQTVDNAVDQTQALDNAKDSALLDKACNNPPAVSTPSQQELNIIEGIISSTEQIKSSIMSKDDDLEVNQNQPPPINTTLLQIEDAPISSIKDQVATLEKLDNRDIFNKFGPMDAQTNVLINRVETLSRSCVQGLPPPDEPETMVLSSQEESGMSEIESPTSPAKEVNKNEPLLSDLQMMPGMAPAEAVHYSEEDKSLGNVASAIAGSSGKQEELGEKGPKIVTEDIITPTVAESVEACLPSTFTAIPDFQDTLVKVSPEDTFQEKSGLTESMVEQLILPGTSGSASEEPAKEVMADQSIDTPASQPIEQETIEISLQNAPQETLKEEPVEEQLVTPADVPSLSKETLPTVEDSNLSAASETIAKEEEAAGEPMKISTGEKEKAVEEPLEQPSQESTEKETLATTEEQPVAPESKNKSDEKETINADIQPAEPIEKMAVEDTLVEAVEDFIQPVESQRLDREPPKQVVIEDIIQPNIALPVEKPFLPSQVEGLIQPSQEEALVGDIALRKLIQNPEPFEDSHLQSKEKEKGVVLPTAISDEVSKAETIAETSIVEGKAIEEEHMVLPAAISDEVSKHEITNKATDIETKPLQEDTLQQKEVVEDTKADFQETTKESQPTEENLTLSSDQKNVKEESDTVPQEGSTGESATQEKDKEAEGDVPEDNKDIKEDVIDGSKKKSTDKVTTDEAKEAEGDLQDTAKTDELPQENLPESSAQLSVKEAQSIPSKENVEEPSENVTPVKTKDIAGGEGAETAEAPPSRDSIQVMTKEGTFTVDEDKDIVQEDEDKEKAESTENESKDDNEKEKSTTEEVRNGIVADQDVLVETLEITEGPLVRSSTPVTEGPGEEPSDSLNVTSETIDMTSENLDLTTDTDGTGDKVSDETEPIPGTESVNTTFSEGDQVPMVEIEIVSEMSESTIKDQGPSEKELIEKEKAEEKAKVRLEKETAGESSGDEKKKKNGVTKVTRGKRIEDVAKADEKKPVKTTRSTLLGKSKPTTTKTSTSKEADKTTMKNKSSKTSITKSTTSTLRKTETEKKPLTPKVSPRITDLNRRPTPKKPSDNTIVVNNVKAVKNNVNLKKADLSAGKSTEKKAPTPTIKRNPPPKSRWGNIMSQIDSSKTTKKPALPTKTAEVKPRTKPAVGSSTGESKTTTKTNRSTSATTTTTTTRSSGSTQSTPRSPRDITTRPTTTTRRTSSASAVDPRTKSSTGLKMTRPSSVSSTARSKQSPDPARPDSRMSTASEASGLNTSQPGSLAGSRPTSAGKPENRKTASLRREKSPSVCSESSTSSQISSHSSRTPRTRTKTREPSTKTEPVKSKSTSMLTRRSIAEPTTTGKDTRRSSLARQTKKDTSPAPTSDKKASNQNRNKATKSSTTSSVKRPNQPDVVTNSVASPGAAEEIARLEALCETRTKQLNIARMQLKASASGFDAMTVLVKYLTEELDAFSCPEVTAKLKAVKGQLSDAQQQIDALAADKVTLEKELSELRQQHVTDLQRLNDSHQGELKELEQRLQAEREKEVENVVEKYSHEVATLKNFLEKNISDMKAKHEKSLQEKDSQHTDHIEKIKRDHELRIKDLQKQHEKRMEEITKTFENIKFTLSDKVEALRGECEEMRSREAQLQERAQHEADLKIHMALAKYQHLPAEIESLRAVMDMRNQELHELRSKKLELEKQLEELPRARDKIVSLQQKVENLEAVIEIKGDYEKQLAEKHQILLRKFEKESKANKRLSMDNEELAWRLANSAESPDLLRRSISHSPTRTSAEPTPEVVRRRKSPACSIPTSPRNQTEFEQSPVTPQSPPKSNLKRSGTYDLLNKDLDEKDMKQSDV